MSRRICLGLALVVEILAALVFIPPIAAAEPKKVALLVGVNKYQRRNFPDLQFAERDVEGLAAELKDLGFQTTVLKGSDSGAGQATRANIETALHKLLANTGKEDIVLISLCGHGLQFQPKGVNKEDAYFCPVDATLGEPKTLLSLSYLIDDVLANKGGRNLLLIDACRDEPKPATPILGPRTPDPVKDPEPDFAVLKRGIQGKVVALPENTAVMFACSAGQQSVESQRFGGGHGAFTYCVLEALKAKAGREMTWTDLVGSVETLMESDPALRKVLDRTESPQEPIHSGNVRRTVLGKVKAMSIVSTVPVPKPTPLPMPMEPSPPINPPSGDKSFTNSVGMRFVLIPAGKFTMGSPASEKTTVRIIELEHAENENQVEVTLSKSYFLGRTEVTQGQWKAVMESEPWKGEKSVKEGANYPATYVTWNDAQEFCKKLSVKEQKPYRLPTEAEWEYACRGGTTTAYSFGRDATNLPAHGWFFLNASKIDNAYAHEVGLKKENPYGLYDMHGNVWELCEDSYADRMPGGRDPLVSNAFGDRTMRGGAWFSNDLECRSAIRGNFQSFESPTAGIGFRVAVTSNGK